MIKRRITFDTPTEVLSFVRACLDDLDVDRLYGAAQEATSEFWRERIFDDLREIDESDSLEAVFGATDGFPEGVSEYTMGGHSDRTRHLHFDLVRSKGSWQLNKIWRCR